MQDNYSVFYTPTHMGEPSTKSTNTKTETHDDHPWKHYSLNMQSSMKDNEEEHEKKFRSINIIGGVEKTKLDRD